MPLCWAEPDEHVMIGPQFIEETIEKIRIICDRLKAVQSRQEKYVDLHRREVEFEVGNFVFLKVSPMRGVTRFGIKGKLAPRYVGPFEITERISDVAYCLRLPPQLSHVHFHVSMLKKYTRDPSHVLPCTKIPLQLNVTYKEQPTEILAKEVHLFKNKEALMVKVRWERHTKEEAT